MKNFKFLAIILCFGMILSGCNNTQKGAGIGAAGGALLGAIVGKVAGNTAVGAAVGTAVGTGAGVLIGKHMDKVKAEAAAKVADAQVEQITDANGLQAVKVTFDSGILFATNKAALNAAAKANLAKFAQVLNNNKDCDVAIFGHTDSTGNDGINIPLSVNRANSVKDYLTSCGVATAQIKSVEGKGSSEPVASNATKEGQAQNRRVEIYMYASQAMINAAEAGNLN